MWTEILNENVGVTHVAGQKVVFGIDDWSERDVQEALAELEHRSAWEHVLEEMQALSAKIENRQKARERLEAAGYKPEEIPL